MLVAFVISPMLGKKLATDPSWRAYLPSWYDFTVKQEKGMTREEFQDMFIEMHKELHERAIRGDFTPDNLEKIDWKKEGGRERLSAKMHAEAAKQGWDKFHPFSDDEGND
jgi:hypothetical protein